MNPGVTGESTGKSRHLLGRPARIRSSHWKHEPSVSIQQVDASVVMTGVTQPGLDTCQSLDWSGFKIKTLKHIAFKTISFNEVVSLLFFYFYLFHFMLFYAFILFFVVFIRFHFILLYYFFYCKLRPTSFLTLDVDIVTNLK